MLNIIFQPFPELKSDRLYLRQMNEADAPTVFALRSDPKVMQYIPRPLMISQEQAIPFIQRVAEKTAANEWINWAITLQGNTQMIGIAGLYEIQAQHHRCQVGYMLLPEYAGKGISTEATKLMLEFVFEQLQMHSVEAIIDPDNIASERVLQKNGFVKEGHIKENELFNGVFLDTVIYSLLRRNYKG